ncbi:ATP-binding protein [Streptomyces sp. NPDC058751]|uniref:ATP-binding protein n=1 Tax=Streptomyces sp. NPDC058751 TaxID=3346623 RepID=UPI00368E546D
MSVGPGAVTRAREAMAGYLADAGVTAGSAFADAVLLVVSELVTNVLRHAPRSPGTNVGITVGAGHLVVSVADTEPRLPDLTPAGMGVGLLMVTELATAFGGTVNMETAAGHDGKAVLVRFPMPS